MEGFMLKKLLAGHLSAALITLFFVSVGYAANIGGTYTLVNDSDGTRPKKGAVVTITFKGSKSGTLSMKAEQPGETVTDTGKFNVSGENITIQFREMEWQAKGASFQLDGCNLVLPFKALGGSLGPGTSTWLKQGSSCGGNELAAATRSLKNNSNAGGASPAQSNTDTYAAPEPKPNQQSAKSGLKTCGCENVKDLEKAIREDEYLQAAYRQKAADYEKELNEYKSFGRLPQRVATKQIEDYSNWATVTLPAEFRAKMGYSAGLTVSPDPQNPGVIDKKKMDAFKKTAKCRELVDDVEAHENYHIQASADISSGKRKLSTAVDLAKEEVAAYGAGLQVLRAALDKLKSRCQWVCIDDKKAYESHEVCERSCRGGLGKNIRLKYRCDQKKN